MTNAFESSYRKLSRAEERITDLDARALAFINSNPYHRVVEPHPDKPDHEIHKIKPARELSGDFNDLGDIFAEFADCLRKSLDNAGYAIAVALNKPSAKNTAFPFAKDLDNLACSIGRSADLPKEIQSLFCGFQPYLGGDDLLYAVNDASIADKHKIIVPAFNVFTRERVSASGTRYFSMPLEHKWDTAKDEMELITLGPGKPEDFKYDIQFAVFPSLGEISGVKGQPIVATAYAMGCKVHSIVRAIEAEAIRLGIVPKT